MCNIIHCAVVDIIFSVHNQLLYSYGSLTLLVQAHFKKPAEKENADVKLRHPWP
jgi:hypothetical protein